MVNAHLMLIGFGMQELLILVAPVVLLYILVALYRRKKGDIAADSLMNRIMALPWFGA